MSSGEYTPELLWNGTSRARTTLLLAHGAGAGMDSPFMNFFAEGLAAAGLRVARFEFPYMDRRRRSGKSGPPDRQPRLIACWQRVLETVDRRNLLIGGKSLGGRIASIVADEANVSGVVCLGYPFHPPGKPEQTRIAHLKNLSIPTLILQGDRDSFGRPDEVRDYPLSRSIRVLWLIDGDHSLRPRKQSGRTEQGNWGEAVEAIARFASDVCGR